MALTNILPIFILPVCHIEMLLVLMRLLEALQGHGVSYKPVGTVGSFFSGLCGKEQQIAQRIYI